MTCRQPKRPHAITSNAAGSLQITKLWWLIPLVKNSCWELTVQVRSLASAKVCYGRNEEGIYIIIRIRAAGMNQGVIWTSLISQPQKSHLFFMAQWILHTQAGRKSTALPNLTVVLKRNAKALDWETKTFVNKDWRAMWKLQMHAAIQNWLPFSLWVWMELAKPQRNNVNIYDKIY